MLIMVKNINSWNFKELKNSPLWFNNGNNDLLNVFFLLIQLSDIFENFIYGH